MQSFFNVNGVIGRGAYEDPEFPTAASLAEHMDYLGIARSLAWHIMARDLHPASGNRQLLKEIAEAGLEDRIIPAFVITPACFYENGTIEFLKARMAEGRVRALRITPEVSRFPVREIERVLAALTAFEPAVFWDCRYGSSDSDMRDIEHLAQTFPGVSFVMTQKMWPGFGAIVDLMWRCPNTFIDISWLHMRNAIEMLVANFGAERVLFGTGYKSHYGAAIAALAHARLDERQRDLIAHGNVERILKLAPCKQGARRWSLLDEKPLWRGFREGKPLDGVEVIDAHGHTGPHTRGWFLPESDFETYPDALRAYLERLGVDRLIVSSEIALFGPCLEGNRETERVCSKHGGMFSGYLVFNPLFADEMVPHFDDFFSRSFFVGFKLLASYWKLPLTSPDFKPVWECADRLALPVLMHTWDDSYSSPATLSEIVPRYPRATFIIGHSGGGTRGRLEAEALAAANKNVFLEFCGSFTTPRPFELSMEKVGNDRVVYGSDTGAHNAAWELGRYLSMPLPDEELTPGLAANMRGILARKR